MSDFSVRSDNVDVEQIMRQIRARIRDKRGVDYTEDEIRELANVKLDKFLDPKGVRSDLLQQFRASRETPDAPRNYAFEDTTLYASSRPFVRAIRRLLNPLLKLLFNPNPMIEALHIQSRLNESYNRSEALYYELVHNLVIETTRLGLEVKSLKMRLESMASRLDFDERRARALEGVVQYRPGAVPPLQPPTGQRDDRRDQGQHVQQGGPRPQGQFNNALDNEGNERRSRRRRRRGRRRGGDRPAGDAATPGAPTFRSGADASTVPTESGSTVAGNASTPDLSGSAEASAGPRRSPDEGGKGGPTDDAGPDGGSSES